MICLVITNTAPNTTKRLVGTGEMVSLVPFSKRTLLAKARLGLLPVVRSSKRLLLWNPEKVFAALETE